MIRQPFQLNYIFFQKIKNQNVDKEFQDVFRRLFQNAKNYEHAQTHPILQLT